MHDVDAKWDCEVDCDSSLDRAGMRIDDSTMFVAYFAYIAHLETADVCLYKKKRPC